LTRSLPELVQVILSSFCCCS